MTERASIWEATAPETDYPALASEARTDVAVVGGGIAGMTTALLLRRLGLEVVLLEAARVGRSTTGRSTVKVTSAQGLRASEIADARSEDDAVAYLRASQEAVETIARLDAELELGVVERCRHVLWAETADEAERLRREMDLLARAGIAATWRHDADLPFAVEGCVVAEEQAIFHPIRYVQGLATAFSAEGGLLFEGSHVTEIDPSEGRVATEDGVVLAREIVVATHADIDDRQLLAARLEPTQEYGIAMRHPVRSLPPDSYLSVGRPTRSVRSYRERDAGDPFLIVVGEKHRVGEGGDTEERYAALSGWAAERLDAAAPQYRWSTHDLMTLDGLPMIGRTRRSDGREWVATGFGTWGMTGATIAARIIAGSIAGRPPGDAELFDPSRGDIRHGVGTFLGMQAKVVRHWVGGRLGADGGDRIPDLAPGDAAVVRGEDGLTAVHRDDHGVLHAVDAKCTHMGCTVAWNPGDRTWDCPCHGSRFGPEGEVLQPPAVHPLAPRRLRDDAA